MIVVSDASPVVALAHLGLVDVLRELYGAAVVPPALVTELAPGTSWPPIDGRIYPFLSVREPTDEVRVADLSRRLDVGEAEAISLALEIGADALLIDEAAGRAAAVALGLRIAGTVSVLLLAKRVGRIASIGPLIDRLRSELRFFISDPLRTAALRVAGELT